MAIVTQVLEDRVRIAEQNVIHHTLPAGQQWTRELPLQRAAGQYRLQDTFDDTAILGWMIQTDDATDSLPQPQTAADYLKIHRQRVEDHGQFSHAWLNQQDPLVRTYVQANGSENINSDPYGYFTISRSAERELVRASNELHLMYLHATDKVLKDDALLALFDIPEVLWPRLRLSWQRRRHDMITGRLDFCMDERGLKVY
ncbi:MAG: Bifunctional glutathionylspermidine synthetase/amidase [Candidatus Erwinia impunctatus]